MRLWFMFRNLGHGRTRKGFIADEEGCTQMTQMVRRGLQGVRHASDLRAAC